MYGVGSLWCTEWYKAGVRRGVHGRVYGGVYTECTVYGSVQSKTGVAYIQSKTGVAY